MAFDCLPIKQERQKQKHSPAEGAPPSALPCLPFNFPRKKGERRGEDPLDFPGRVRPKQIFNFSSLLLPHSQELCFPFPSPGLSIASNKPASVPLSNSRFFLPQPRVSRTEKKIRLDDSAGKKEKNDVRNRHRRGKKARVGEGRKKPFVHFFLYLFSH